MACETHRCGCRYCIYVGQAFVHSWNITLILQSQSVSTSLRREAFTPNCSVRGLVFTSCSPSLGFSSTPGIMQAPVHKHASIIALEPFPFQNSKSIRTHDSTRKVLLPNFMDRAITNRPFHQ